MKIRSVFSFALYVTASAAALSMIPWLCGIAHAAADPMAAVTSSLGWPEWFGIGLAALAGVKALVDAALGFFRYLAPKTTTTVDDSIRDDLQLAHDKLDDLTALVQGIAKPVAVAAQNVAVPNSVPAKTTQGGFTRIGLMLMFAASGVALVAVFGCGASQRETTIRAALVSVDSARDGFLAYDRAHELSLTAHCDPTAESREQCQAKVDASNKALAEYQAKRAKVDPLVGAAYRSVAAAWLLNDQPSLAGMQAAVGRLFDAVKPFLNGSK